MALESHLLLNQPSYTEDEGFPLTKAMLLLSCLQYDYVGCACMNSPENTIQGILKKKKSLPRFHPIVLRIGADKVPQI